MTPTTESIYSQEDEAFDGEIGVATQPPRSADIRALRARVSGEIVLPGEAGWDAARQAWNLAVDQRPAAVVYAASVDDVVATTRFAREHGLRVAPQGTGHNAAPLGPLDGTILLKTSAMRCVSVDPVRRVARVEAGALWMDVVPVASAHGLIPLLATNLSDFSAVPPALAEILHADLEENIRFNLGLTAELARVSAALRAAAVPCAGLSSTTLLPAISEVQRTMNFCPVEARLSSILNHIGMS